MGKKRKVPGINGSSSADIAFMLLLFFLLTTSMDTDRGLARRLPRPPETEKPEEQEVNKRNMLQVRVNSYDQIQCGGEEVTLPQLREKAKEFIENPNDDIHLPLREADSIPFFGVVMRTKQHVISLQCDRVTSYQKYLDVQNELAAAYTELRDVISRQQFGKRFFEIEDEEQRTAVLKYYPLMISEAEPITYGEKKKK